MNISSIKAIFLYEYFLIKNRPERLLFTFFWPLMNLFIWGYASNFLSRNDSFRIGPLLIGAIILWSFISSAQYEISGPFSEKISRFQLRNFLIASMSEFDYLTALTILGLFKSLLSFLFLVLIGYSLFAFNIFNIGLILFFLIFNLYFFGWILGLFLSSLMLMFGTRISFLNAPLAGLLMPFSCVFYPREILPPLLKFFSWFLPPSYIFEGLRNILFEGNIGAGQIIIPTALNILFFIITVFFFSFMFKLSLKKGRLAKI